MSLSIPLIHQSASKLHHLDSMASLQHKYLSVVEFIRSSAAATGQAIDSQAMADVKTQQLAILKNGLLQTPVFPEEAADMQHLLQQESPVFTIQDRQALAQAILQQASRGGMNVSHMRASNQKMLAPHMYLFENHWAMLIKDDADMSSMMWEVASDFVGFLNLRNPNEPTYRAILSTIVAANEARRNALTALVFKTKLDQLKDLFDVARNGLPVSTTSPRLLNFPEDVSTYMQMFTNVFDNRQPAPCPIDTSLLIATTRSMPARKTHKALHASQETAPKHFGQPAQIVDPNLAPNCQALMFLSELLNYGDRHVAGRRPASPMLQFFGQGTRSEQLTPLPIQQLSPSPMFGSSTAGSMIGAVDPGAARLALQDASRTTAGGSADIHLPTDDDDGIDDMLKGFREAVPKGRKARTTAAAKAQPKKRGRPSASASTTRPSASASTTRPSASASTTISSSIQTVPGTPAEKHTETIFYLQAKILFKPKNHELRVFPKYKEYLYDRKFPWGTSAKDRKETWEAVLELCRYPKIPSSTKTIAELKKRKLK